MSSPASRDVFTRLLPPTSVLDHLQWDFLRRGWKRFIEDSHVFPRQAPSEGAGVFTNMFDASGLRDREDVRLPCEKIQRHLTRLLAVAIGDSGKSPALSALRRREVSLAQGRIRDDCHILFRTLVDHAEFDAAGFQVVEHLIADERFLPEGFSCLATSSRSRLLTPANRILPSSTSCAIAPIVPSMGWAGVHQCSRYRSR